MTADTWQNSSDPSNNFVGIAVDDGGDNALTYAATSAAVAPLRVGTHQFVVTVVDGKVTVKVDGVAVLSDVVVSLPDDVLVGFTASTGGAADRHAVSNVAITAGRAGDPDPDPDPGGNIPSPVAGGWTENGSAAVAGQELVLTPANVGYNAGSAFYPTPVSAADLSLGYDVKIGPGKHADGLAFVLADPAAGATALGGAGWRLGYGGINGVAVTADTYKNSSDPSNNFVGIATGDRGENALTYEATSTAVPQLRVGTHRFFVTVAAGLLSVQVDGVVVIPPTAVTLPDDVLLGFTAGTGSQADRHAISNVVITAGGGGGGATPVALRTDASASAAASFAASNGLGDVTPVTFCALPRHNTSRV